MMSLKNNEIRQISQMALLITIAVMSIVSVALNLMLDWEKWPIPIIVFAVASAALMHVSGRPSENIRLYIFSVIILVELFYYAANVETLYDSTPVIVVLLILFVMTQERLLVIVCLIVGYLGMLYHLIIKYTSSGYVTDAQTVIRTVWHLLLVMIAGMVAIRMVSLIQRIIHTDKNRIEELEAENQSANDFLANVSHEIRTPVNAVIGLTGVCVEKEQDPSIRHDMQSVVAAGRRVADQIGDILDYSEIDMNRLAVNAEDYMLSSLLNDLANEIAPLRRPEIELVIDVDPSLPSVMHTDVMKLKKILRHLISNSLKYTRDGGVYVHLYPIRQDYGINLCIEVTDTGIGMNSDEVERIFEHFYQADSGRTRSTNGLGLGMAIVTGFVRSLGGFMTIDSQPGVGTTVHVSLPQQVIDPSKCMSVNDAESLMLGAFLHFSKFPHPSVREYYDRMVRDIVQGLGVTMHRVETIDNLKKLLSTMRMTHLFVGQEEYEADIPFMEELSKKVIVVVVASDDFKLSSTSHARILRKPFYCFPVISVLNAESVSSIRDEGRMFCHGVRALVVDDEPMNLAVAKGVLRRYDMIVETADSGEESVRFCRETPYDIVFMDHMMPGMDGIEAMKLIRADADKEHISFPIVALTANAVSTAREMFLREGFDGFVSKPIELAELERVMRSVLPRDRVTTENVDGPEPVIEEEETAQTAANDDAPESALSRAGIDSEAGMRFCQHDEELYRSLLAQFVSDAENKRTKLETSLEAGDYDNYAIVVHALKSTAKTIGATGLSDMAKGLETAAKQRDGETLTRDHDAMMTAYRTVTDAIAETCLPEGQAAEDSGILEFPAE